MTATITAPFDVEHWATTIDTDHLHEPTVRAIIDTMKRSGARFAAHVLDCQLRHSQIEPTDNDQAKRLRDVADFVEANPTIAITVEGAASWWPVSIVCSDVEDMHATRRAIGGKWSKEVTEHYFVLTGRMGDAYVKLSTPRGAVCERVVVGTETKLVPDPDAPKVEREVEIVEWVCPDAVLAGVEQPDVPAPADNEIPF